MTKKLKYSITDETALREAYPQLFKEETVTITKTIIDKAALYGLVKANHRIERDIPGVFIDAPPLSRSISNESPETKAD